MKFKYTRYSSNVLRPVIRVGVRYQKRLLFYDVLVDSGADINVFDVELAGALGIDLESGVAAKVTGVTGEPASVYIHPVELMVGDQSFYGPGCICSGHKSVRLSWAARIF